MDEKRDRVRRRGGWPLPSIRLAATLLVPFALLVLTPAAGRADDKRPNILLYIVDTMRADGLAFLGNEQAATPHFDAFAKTGVVFVNAFANASWTRASVATLLTGLHPWHHGAENRAHRLSDSVETLSERLAQQGYRTAMVTANPNVGTAFGFDQSIDRFVELYARRNMGVVSGDELISTSVDVNRAALAWLQEVEEPFCLILLSVDPHAPYQPPPEFDPGTLRGPSSADGQYESIRRSDLTAVDRARIRELYQGEITRNDHAFGQLLEAMEGMGKRENTIVVLTADHGEEFWEYGVRGHGKSLVEEEIHVPLVFSLRGSERVVAGTRVDREVSLVDVVPSLLDLAGLPASPDLDGRSLFGPSLAEGTAIETGINLSGIRMRAVRRHPWKLVFENRGHTMQLYDLRTPNPEAEPVLLQRDPEAAKARVELGVLLDASRTLEREAVKRRVRENVDQLPPQVRDSLRALGYLE